VTFSIPSKERRASGSGGVEAVSIVGGVAKAARRDVSFASACMMSVVCFVSS
jgi:hypothetical protein